MTDIRVLVVDDTPINRQGTAIMLESLGYKVDQAASGTEAIELFKMAQYAAVILDFNMPHMNGFECAAELRELEKPAQRHTPIICMSAQKEIAEASKVAGMDDFLSKECSCEQLHETVLKHVKKHTTSP